MIRKYEEGPKGKHFKAAVILLRELTHCGVLTPQRAAELVQSENKDLEGLLCWTLALRRVGERGAHPLKDGPRIYCRLPPVA